MMNAKKTMAAMGLLPLAAFGVDVGGSIGLETGYRSDNIKSTFDGGWEKVKDLNGISLGVNGRLTINDFYVRGGGDYVWILTTPKYTDSAGDAVDFTKEHGFDAGGALGYSFYFNNGEFSLAPEAGFAYQNLTTVTNLAGIDASEAAGLPFVGFDFNWMFSSDWKFGFLFNWSFFGFRSSDLTSASGKTTRVTDGYYMGPEAKVAFDYSFTDNWSMGVAYRFKYIFTGKENVAGLTNEKQAWTTNNATLKVDYTF